MTLAKVPVRCPHCGEVALEPPTAYSTVCRRCRGHFRVQEVLRPLPTPTPSAPPGRLVSCFGCGHSLEVAAAAQSTLCRHCGGYVDLQDYRVTRTLAKNVRTKGRLVIEESGCLLNTDSIAGEVILRGRVLGRLTAERSLEIHNRGEIKGVFRTALLIIPSGVVFRWPENLAVRDAQISGELVANLEAEGTVHLGASARFFGRLRARGMVVESGAVLDGTIALNHA
jgi:cytoskeletal protein CcmA (bactofilin family)